MNEETVVLLHSKYCPFSLNYIKKIPSLTMDIITICIDHKNVRDLILNSDYRIQTIPCILVFNDTITAYEGDMLDHWTKMHTRQKTVVPVKTSTITPINMTTNDQDEKDPLEHLKKQSSSRKNIKNGKKPSLAEMAKQMAKDREIYVKKNDKQRVEKF